MGKTGPIVSVSALLRALCALAALMLLPSMAQAQSVYQYTNNTAGAIADSTTCATVLTRNFTVSTAYSVSDVNLGVAFTHTTRSHLRVSLTSPGGTTVSMMTNVGGNADHLSVLFDDEAATAIATHTANDSTAAVPPYQRTFGPANLLSAFDGQAAAGTWTMTICDSVAGTTGNFTRADLYIAPREADLSLTKGVSNAAPVNGANINYTLSVTNAATSTLTATGIQVRDQLPLGVIFVSATGTGSYNGGTGVWSVGSLTPGASASITMTVNVTATQGATVTNSAEISASLAFDGDSTPNNGSTTEDDDASVGFTVSGTRVAGTPPTIICPSGSVQRTFNWSASNWTNDTASQIVAIPFIGNTNVSFALSGGAWQTDPNTGQPSPNSTNFSSYGLPTNPWVIRTAVDFASNSEIMTATYTLPTAVPAAQFQLFDVDYQANSWADRVEVTASFNGSPVPVTLTNGTANYVIGNVFYGDGASTSSQSFGNVFVTVTQPVDTIIVTYGNHANLGVIANPVAQFIGWGGFSRICDPVAAISATKISSILSDGVSASNPKAIPGAVLQYCITINNAGSGTATGVSVGDALPPNVVYVAGSMRSGGTCGTATTVEDDDNTGADESDPIGISITGSTITATRVTMLPSTSFVFLFNATVN